MDRDLHEKLRLIRYHLGMAILQARAMNQPQASFIKQEVLKNNLLIPDVEQMIKEVEQEGKNVSGNGRGKESERQPVGSHAASSREC